MKPGELLAGLPRPSCDGGTAIVCGSAETLFSDLDEAVELRPSHTIIAVNAAAEVVAADHLFTLHPEKMEVWRERQFQLTGRWAPTHSAPRPRPNVDIDFWWESAGGKGTSGWGAAKMAQAMGYDEIILCGVPMDAMPYQHRGPAKAFMAPAVLDIYRRAIASETAWHAKVRSMSGWTRQLLGAPC